MLNMNYIGDSAVYSVEFSTVSNNVVELKGDFPVLTDGFTLSRADHNDNWDYSAYTTVYREIDGGTQFSDDGSVYTQPNQAFPVPEPYEPTPEELEEIEQKRKEAAAIPNNAELAAAVMELAENVSDIEDAIAELGNMIS